VQTGPAIYGDVVHRFDPEPASVPEARRIAREFADDLMQGEQANKHDMAVTEVFSNAVRHSGSDREIMLALTQKDDYLCVRVSDGGTGLVPRPGAMTTEPGAGFGLFLVEQLTRRWGMTREDGRTRVWFELDYAETAA
jgi:anti-sigma regulatory factor (Ser/Thr protein kinase)